MPQRSDNVPAAYTLEQTARLTGVSERQLRSWAARGFYRPQLERAGLYSFTDLVALSTLNKLRNERKITLRTLLHFGTWLREQDVDNPWASLRFRTDGKELVVRDPQGRKRWFSSKPAGQLSSVDELELPFVDVVRRVHAAAEKLHKRTRHGDTEKVRGVRGSERVIVGTRIPTRAIREYHDAGYSVAAIVAEYPGLTAADVKAALEAETAA